MSRPAKPKKPATKRPRAAAKATSGARASRPARPAGDDGTRGPGRPSHGTGAEQNYPANARVIKRYGNRRLYDAKLSRCVTMAEIADMVRQREDVRIVDGDNGEDLTKRVLVQIILEQQNAQQLEVLPVELLHQIIAVRSQPVAGWLEQYLQAGAEFIDRQSNAAAPALRGMTDSLGNLFPWLNPESWKNVPGAPDLSQYTHAAAAPAPEPKRAPASSDSSIRDELAELQARFADLTSRVGRT